MGKTAAVAWEGPAPAWIAVIHTLPIPSPGQSCPSLFRVLTCARFQQGVLVTNPPVPFRAVVMPCGLGEQHTLMLAVALITWQQQEPQS